MFSPSLPGGLSSDFAYNGAWNAKAIGDSTGSKAKSEAQ